MFKNILVAVDGSEHAQRASRLAGDISRTMGAHLWVITVYDPLPNYLGYPNLETAFVRRMDLAEELIRNASVEIGEIPGGLETEILEGPVAEAILGLIETRQIDLVIMGTRGLSRLQGLLLGSQSQKVIQYAPCPVMLVR